GAKFGVRRLLRQDEVGLDTDKGPMLLGLAHGWVGPTWVEIIRPIDGSVAIYRDWLSAGATFRFHHIAVRAPDDQAYDQAVEETEAAHHPISFRVANQAFRAFYADTVKDLGHYIEYLHFFDTSFFQNIPQNVEGEAIPS
ncbi:MAG TPA: hypothetical protein VJP88_01020, partial [Caulobacteraceae bacterium]|nr:hypothetical protein [Caulobacteraceae bacterium]